MLNNGVLFFSVYFSELKELSIKYINKFLISLFGLLPTVAFADGDFADMAGRFADGAKSGTKSALIVAQLIGALFVIGALISMKAKKDNPQIKGWHIIVGLLVGGALCVVPEIIKRSQAQVGLTPVNIG